MPAIHAGLSLRGGEIRACVTATETTVHGDTICFMVKAWARHTTAETVLINGWRLAAIGGGRLAVGGGWRWAVGGWWSLGAVLKGCH